MNEKLVGKGGTRDKLWKVASWHFVKDDIAVLLGSIGNLKALIDAALSDDHL